MYGLPGAGCTLPPRLAWYGAPHGHRLRRSAPHRPALSPEERVRLLERVGSSLPEDDEAFVAEMNRRVADFDAGMAAIPAEAVHAELALLVDR